MAEGNDFNSNFSSIRSYPKDIQLMANILKEMGVNDYEPRVLNHMLEFSYRYLITILEDAHLYSTHAKKACIDSEDVKLAINLYQDRILTGPPSRDVIAEVAKQRNSMPLPQIKSSAGLRLPPDRHNLTACNYRLKPSFKKGKFHTVSKLSGSSLSTNTEFTANKMLSSVNLVPTMSILSKSSSTETKPVSSISKPIPTPIIKFSDGKTFSPTASLTAAPVSTTITTSSSQPKMLMPGLCETSGIASQILMPTLGTAPSTTNQIMTPTMSSSSYIQMPAVSVMNTTEKIPSETKGAKRIFEEDDDYDMQ